MTPHCRPAPPAQPRRTGKNKTKIERNQYQYVSFYPGFVIKYFMYCNASGQLGLGQQLLPLPPPALH